MTEVSSDNAQVVLWNFENLVRKSLYEMLCRHGYKVDCANSTDELNAILNENCFHIILTDVKNPEDANHLKDIKEKVDNSEVIVIASYGKLEIAVNCMKMGAFDYLVRPVKDEDIVSAVERALLNKPLKKKKYKVLECFTDKKNKYYDLVGKSEKISSIYSIVERIADSRATVLIQGESGTGKRLIAHSIHKADKRRKNKPFVELSCGALPRDIIESELFGHTKGAFTGAISERKGRFELADGGTILLDDIDSLPLDLQVKLLRILQQKEFEKVGSHKTIKIDVRVIATTNQDIKRAVHEKKFREDLFYRINVISMDVPSLRERKEDLPDLVHHFIDLYSKENHKKINSISEEALEILINYNWPGNIRELENIIERAVILDTDAIITEADLPEIILNESPFESFKDGSKAFIKNIATTLKEVLHEPEKVHILRVLKEVNWNKKKAATKLGVNRTTLYNKIRKYDLFSYKD